MVVASELQSVLIGTLLAYAGRDQCAIAGPVTAGHDRSGLVVAGRDAVSTIRQLRDSRYTRPIIADVKRWADELATAAVPLAMQESDGLMQLTLDEWSASVLANGATAVLTPSRFVRAGDWSALDAVVRAGNAATMPGLITLIATDAAMLDDVIRFICVVKRSTRPVGFVFAAAQTPLRRRQRAAGLRKVVAAMPGCLLLATEVLAATDALAQGAGSAAIGVTGGLRRPRRPGDPKDGPYAVNALPGLFLRDLWEHRSPGIYADWYAGAQSPCCRDCGRSLDYFDTTRSERETILRHGIRGWLDVLSEIGDLPSQSQRAWLAEERLDAFTRHANLRPVRTAVEADPLLRQLVELDDPRQRRTTPAGGWR